MDGASPLAAPKDCQLSTVAWWRGCVVTGRDEGHFKLKCLIYCVKHKLNRPQVNRRRCTKCAGAAPFGGEEEDVLRSFLGSTFQSANVHFTFMRRQKAVIQMETIEGFSPTRGLSPNITCNLVPWKYQSQEPFPVLGRFVKRIESPPPPLF